MNKVETHIQHSDSNLDSGLATLINICAKVGGTPFLTAVQGATSIKTLRQACQNLTGIQEKNRPFFDHLALRLQTAYNLGRFGASDAAAVTAITNLATINAGNGLSTDLLYLLCTSRNAVFTPKYNRGSYSLVHYSKA